MLTHGRGEAPCLAGKVIVQAGMPALLQLLLVIALANWAINAGRLMWRRRQVTGMA
ncbi:MULTISPECIES: hypothetical protein [unclassified Pseudomonas]|uniref:hypothetical protein n=1 Tax=unclassified Pseudomonas TaxID=196821 RepID=UPI00382482B3